MTQKIFITKTGKATITCPECGKVKLMDVSRFAYADKPVSLKVTCTCGHGFSATLERRLHIRKNVGLKGKIIFKDDIYMAEIIDISRMGLKIRSEKIMDIQKGEKIVVDFILDDPGKSKVEKEVIVRKINGTDIGVGFVSQDHYDKFGPYLLFHFN